MLTIGHSTLPIEIFLNILQDNGVRIVVDIRTIPKSRHNPQFTQETLSAALLAKTMGYHWQPSLGGLRKPRKDSLLNAGWLNHSFRGYADYMQTREFAAAIEELLERQSLSETVLMCAEAVPWRCHRSMVADALTVRGCPVEHILYGKQGASHRQLHHLTQFAQVEGTRVWYPGEANLFSKPDSL